MSIYISIALILYFLCLIGCVVAVQLEEADIEDCLIVCALSAVYSAVWPLTVPFTIICGLAYLLGSLIANIIKKRKAKKNENRSDK